MRERGAKSRFILVLTILLVACFSVSPKAHAFFRCDYVFAADKDGTATKAFEEVLKQVENVDLSHLREQLKIVYANGALTRAQQNQKAFHHYLAFRLQKVSLSEKKEILRKMEKIEIVDKPDDVNGYYHNVSETLKLEMPKEYLGSVLDLAIRVHEVEHLIQDVQIGKWRETESPLKMKYYTELLFSAEKGAMLAEANFLLSLPRHIAMEDLRLPAKRFTIAEKFREGVYGANGSPTEYLFIQWNAYNRYSRAEFAQTYIVKMASSRPVLGTAGIISLLALIQAMHSSFGF